MMAMLSPAAFRALPIAEKMRTIARLAGIEVFILPIDDGVQGRAYRDAAGRPFITVYSTRRGVFLARIIAHEIGHHMAGHAREWTSIPVWRREMEAEARALDLLRPFLRPATSQALARQSRDYLRPAVQAFIDAGIHVHGELEAGVELGCDIPDDLLPVLAARRDLRGVESALPDDGEIGF